MNNKLLIMIITALVAVLPSVTAGFSGLMVATTGYARQSGGNNSHVVGSTWLLGGYTAACVTVYSCTSFASCGVNYRKECLVVTDIVCSRAYTGALSTYDVDCDWCDENPDLEVCSRERNNMYLLIFIPLMLGLFALIGAATLGEDHPALRIGLFILSFVSAISATYIGSNIVSTSDTQVQSALGVTNNWMTWIFIVVVIYFLIYLLYKLFDTIGRQKEEKLRY